MSYCLGGGDACRDRLLSNLSSLYGSSSRGSGDYSGLYGSSLGGSRGLSSLYGSDDDDYYYSSYDRISSLPSRLSSLFGSVGLGSRYSSRGDYDDDDYYSSYARPSRLSSLFGSAGLGSRYGSSDYGRDTDYSYDRDGYREAYTLPSLFYGGRNDGTGTRAAYVPYGSRHYSSRDLTQPVVQIGRGSGGTGGLGGYGYPYSNNVDAAQYGRRFGDAFLSTGMNRDGSV